MNPIVFLIAFLLSLIPTLFGSIFFPFAGLTYFAPFIVLLIYKKTRIEILCYCLAIGFILDLLTSQTPFGFWILNYWASAWLLRFFKPFYFEDKFLTLPLLTVFFAQISTLIYVFSMNFFFLKMQLSLSWVFTDLVLYPIFDGCYAVLVFSIPLYYLNKLLPQKRRSTKSFRLSKD
ncbi:MAG: hypothetical protein S4CHLAM6_00830 [Chlamydiae bacterium]|nr:hypothetical protein [Chlamydiota bacterium]